jgi:hypothetical protein
MSFPKWCGASGIEHKTLMTPFPVVKKTVKAHSMNCSEISLNTSNQSWTRSKESGDIAYDA